jgi:hypothetical protein
VHCCRFVLNVYKVLWCSNTNNVSVGFTIEHILWHELLYIIFMTENSYTDTFEDHIAFVWEVFNLQGPDSTNMGLSFLVFHEKTGLHVCANNLFFLSVIVVELTEECKSTKPTYQWRVYHKVCLGKPISCIIK